MAEEMIVVSLREIADRFGIGVEGARAKAKRRAAKGSWRILPQNHPADPLRIELPAAEFESAEGTQRSDEGDHAHPNIGPDVSGSTDTPSHKPKREESYDIKALVGLLEKMSEQSAQTTERLIAAERGKSDAERRADLAEAAQKASQEAADARLTAVRAELQAIVDRQSQATREAQEELASWRARPWWRRMVG